MNNIKSLLITTDSVCDLPQELIEQLQIPVLSYRVQTNQGQFVDGTEIDTNDLMIYMRCRDNNAMSVPPTVEQYEAFFREQLSDAQQILHITMGKRAGDGYAHAVEAAQKFPQVVVFDSGQLSSGMGIVVLKAVQMAEEGLAMEELVEQLTDVSKCVTTTFVVQDTEFMYRAKRLSSKVKSVCDQFLLRPVLCMRNSKICVQNAWVGQWTDIIPKYVKSCLKRPWSIDDEVLFITHVNLKPEQLELVKETVEKRFHFKKVYVQKAGPAIACNCGEGGFGLLFMRKKKTHSEPESDAKPGLLDVAKHAFFKAGSVILKEENSIQQRMLNLILTAALIGGFVSMLVTLALGAWQSFCVALLMLAVVCICMYISIVRDNVQLSGFIICFFANMVIFPLMFFASGGIYSGMPVWLVLGLVFDFLILKGSLSFGMFAFNLVTLLGCILLAQKKPQLLVEMPDGYMVSDIIQTIIFVSCIFGVIFKYQTHVYEKQKEQLMEHEKELLAANRAKSSFLANMSHEIRTPINGIIGMNTMLLRECGDNEALFEYGKNIQSASQSLLSIVNDILDISKIESGKLEIIPQDYDLFSVLNDCYNMTASRAADKGLEFMIHINPTLPCGLYGDEIRIRQIINNLLSNAVKYTDDGTVQLEIDYERRSDAAVVLVIAVRDTGIGIKREDIGKLFESFTRVDEKRNSGVEGTGLGLNLTKDLLNMMGGTITVDSVYNEGSVFCAKIPQAIRRWAPIGDFSKRYQETLAQKNLATQTVYAPDAKVLVVDDVPMNLMVAKGLLKYTGMTVETADGGVAALERIQQDKYDLIFLDHLMPVMDGIECLHRMKEMEEPLNLNTPVIILTANAIMGAREEYIHAGFTDYLAKPIQEDELNHILMKYLPSEMVSYRRIEPNKEQGTAPQRRAKAKADEPADYAVVQAQAIEQPSKQEQTQETATPDAEGEQSVMERLSLIEGLDVSVGLGYCINDETFYLDMLKEYVTGKKADALNAYFAANDWENYRITAHALKSTSLTIGATQLSEQAKKLEFACKEDDFDYVREHHDSVVKRYTDFLEQLNFLETIFLNG